jgi:uncharacterized protein
MKLQADAVQGPSISGYGPGWVAVNGEKFTSSLIISSMGMRMDWNCSIFDALQASHFEQLAALNPELVLFGSGERIRFPQPQWLQALYAQRIGLETMDTQAACRTYNFLAGEGRKVLAALLL